MRPYIILLICVLTAITFDSGAQTPVWDEALGTPVSGSYYVKASSGEIRVLQEIPDSPDTDWSIIADNLDMGFVGTGQTWIRVLDIEVVDARKVNIVISYSQNTSVYSRRAFLGTENTNIEILQMAAESSPVTPPDPDPDPGDGDDDDDDPTPEPNPVSPDVPDMEPPSTGLSMSPGRNWILSEFPSESGSRRVAMYYDGLGFLEQKVNVGGNIFCPNDIITIYSHDIFGNQTIERLPYVGVAMGGSFNTDARSRQQSYYAAEYGNADGRRAYIETAYESCPEGRVLRSYLPGSVLSEHPTSIEYVTNTTGEVEILDVDEATGAASVSGYYLAGSLYGERVTDGDGRMAVIWKDSDGRTVRSDRGDGENEVRTLYGYDSRGNLRWVVSPEGYARIPLQGTIISVDGEFAGRYCWRYFYDSRGNLTASYRPGAGLILTLYDAAGRLLMRQDQKMRESGVWVGRTYDNVGRVISERIIRDTTGTDWAAGLPELDGEGLTVLNSSGEGRPLRIFCYDKMPSSLDESIGFEEITDIVTQDLVNEDLRGKLAYERVSTSFGVPYAERAYYYDLKGNVIQIAERRPEGVLRSSFRYDSQRRLTLTQVEYTEPRNDIGDVYFGEFTYDNDGRLLSETADLNGHLATVTHRYDSLGRLIYKEYTCGNGEGALQESFTYNLQGWEAERNVSRGEEDIFASALRYYDAPSGTSPSFTGDISSWKWQNKDSLEREYRFRYDAVNRLTEAMEYEGGVLTNSHTERSISYDRNGNILSMVRSNGGIADTLTFSYDGNRRTGNGYAYDANGNLTYDGVTGISAAYDILNLPHSLFGDGDNPTEYVYLADGTKINSIMEEAYQGYYYAGPFVYRLRSNLYGHSGVSVRYGGGVIMRDYEGQYSTAVYLRDHLGSTRVKVRSCDEIVGVYDYLPYGELASYCPPSELSNDYLFGGKELESAHNVRWYDSGARYQTTHGIFTSQDPLAEKYYSISPYAYCAGNPVNNVDPDGKDVLLSKMTNSSHIRAFESFLSTRTGSGFIRRFMHKGETISIGNVQITATENGDRYKDAFWIYSANYDDKTIRGQSYIYLRNSKGQLIRGNQAGLSNDIMPIEDGVTHVIYLNQDMNEKEAAAVMGHEAFVHVAKDSDYLSKWDKGNTNGLTLFKFITNLATDAASDHESLSKGECRAYKNVLYELSKLLSDNYYIEYYFEDVKRHR